MDKFYVRSLVTGAWRGVDQVVGGNKVGERQLICPVENGKWCIDHRPIETEAGVCITAINQADAEVFLAAGRATMVIVEPNTVVEFAAEEDAMFFVRKGLADRMSLQEIAAWENHKSRAIQQMVQQMEEERIPSASDVAAAEAAAAEGDQGGVDAGTKPRRGRPPGAKPAAAKPRRAA